MYYRILVNPLEWPVCNEGIRRSTATSIPDVLRIMREDWSCLESDLHLVPLVCQSSNFTEIEN